MVSVPWKVFVLIMNSLDSRMSKILLVCGMGRTMRRENVGKMIYNMICNLKVDALVPIVTRLSSNRRQLRCNKWKRRARAHQ